MIRTAAEPATAEVPPAVSRSPADGVPGRRLRGCRVDTARYVALVLGLSLINLLAGRLGLMLATPPGYATAIFPPAGIALGAMLLYGPRMWPGVFLGSFLLNVSIAPAPLSAISLAIAASIAAGSAAQAWFGVWLIRRLSPRTAPGLDSAGGIVRVMLLGGVVACLIASGWGAATLAAAGVVTPAAVPWNWFNWWIGDSMGVLVFTPVLLLLADRQTQTRRRLALVGVPLLLTLAIAVLVFFYAAEAEARRLGSLVERQSANVTAALGATLGAYLGAVEAVKSYYDASEFVSRDEFRRFALPLIDKHPGILALSWVPRVPRQARAEFEARARADASRHRDSALAGFRFQDHGADGGFVPAGERAEYFPAFYIEPLARGRSVLGLEVAHTAARARALQAAATSGNTAITTPVELVGGDPGFLAITPVYAGGADPGNAVARRVALRGFALGVFRIEDIVANARVSELADGVPVLIEDPGAPAARRRVYAQGSAQEGAEAVTRSVEFGGRTWQLRFVPGAEFVATNQSQSAFLVLFGGVAFTAMVGAFLLIITGRMASIEGQVAERTAALRKTNEELEKFAYAASHDLKAPLRGVRQLTHWLEAERDNVLTARSRRHLGQLRGRVGRMDALLDGLLRYTRAGRVAETAERVDFAELLAETIELASLPDGFEVAVPAHLPVIHSYRMPLLQVFLNLITNAVKHHDSTSGRIEIHCLERHTFLQFDVIDDGPGIPDAFRDRVFGLFQTLKGRDEVEASGMGLAIVKKIIETHGGSVWVQQRDGRGAHIRFTWSNRPPDPAVISGGATTGGPI